MLGQKTVIETPESSNAIRRWQEYATKLAKLANRQEFSRAAQNTHPMRGSATGKILLACFGKTIRFVRTKRNIYFPTAIMEADAYDKQICRAAL